MAGLGRSRDQGLMTRERFFFPRLVSVEGTCLLLDVVEHHGRHAAHRDARSPGWDDVLHIIRD